MLSHRATKMNVSAGWKSDTIASEIVGRGASKNAGKIMPAMPAIVRINSRVRQNSPRSRSITKPPSTEWKGVFRTALACREARLDSVLDAHDGISDLRSLDSHSGRSIRGQNCVGMSPKKVNFRTAIPPKIKTFGPPFGSITAPTEGHRITKWCAPQDCRLGFGLSGLKRSNHKVF